MKRPRGCQFSTLPIAAFLLGVMTVGAWAAGSGHDHDHDEQREMLEEMRERHSGHDHEHDFEAMDEVSEEDMHRAMDLMADLGLAVPPMDSERGAEIFMDKGCIVCHSVNGVGGAVGPSLNAADMPEPMNAFEFAARMWRGAPVMAEMQENLLGDMINLTGQELADIIAFTHDEEQQKEISSDQIPEKYSNLIPE